MRGRQTTVPIWGIVQDQNTDVMRSSSLVIRPRLVACLLEIPRERVPCPVVYQRSCATFLPCLCSWLFGGCRGLTYKLFFSIIMRNASSLIVAFPSPRGGGVYGIDYTRALENHLILPRGISKRQATSLGRMTREEERITSVVFWSCTIPQIGTSCLPPPHLPLSRVPSSRLAGKYHGQ